jgi:maleylpyruvate isomerase
MARDVFEIARDVFEAMAYDATMHRIHNAHRRLIASLVTLTDDQARQPSLLPDWSVAHLISHIAGNAEAFVNAAGGLKRGEVGVMYSSIALRNEAIEQGSVRSADELRAHTVTSSELFESEWGSLSPEALSGQAVSVSGMQTFNASDILMRRLREVEVHHADLGLATFSFRDWSDALVDADLPNQTSSIASRLGRPLHVIDDRGEHHFLGDNAIDCEPIEIDRRSLLAWSMNRIDIDGLPTLGPWQTPPPPAK